MTRLLALDCGQSAATSVYTLYNSDGTDFFTFETAEQLREFTKYYYRNPIAALFAYRSCHG